MEITAYNEGLREAWNDFVKGSKNGTFLLEREFMEYHKDRYEDCSVLVMEGKCVKAVFPANIDRSEGCVVYSHQGLTYGSLIISERTTLVEVLDYLQAIAQYYRETVGAKGLVYKTIPYIYASCACEEDRYALFRMGATLISRAASTVIDLHNRIPMRELRRRMCKKALQNGLKVTKHTMADHEELTNFWTVLTEVLSDRHNVRPVHSEKEIRMLMDRFPENIQFFSVTDEGRLVAGCIVFVTERVAHIQYISANKEGRRLGALDLLFCQLIEKEYCNLNYLDFGVSTENGGQWLNEGLIFQKEGFGGRTVCYDTYVIREL